MTSAPALPRVRGSRPHRAVLAAFAGLGLAVGSWGGRIPDVREDLDLSEGSLGAALLGLSIGAVAGSWLGGALVRRLGSRPVVTAGWLLVAAALVPPGLAGSWTALALAVTALGLAIGIIDVAVNGAGVQLEEASDEPLLSGLHAGWNAGLLLGTGAAALAITAGVGTGLHLALVSVVVAGAALVAGPHVPAGRIDVIAEALHDDHPDPVEPRRRAAARRLAALAAIGGAIFLVEGALLDWSGILVRDDLDGGAVLGALAVTGFSAGGLAGRLAGDRLAARWGPDRLIRTGVVVAAMAFTAALASPWAAPVPVLLGVVGAGIAPSVPLAFAAAGRAHGERGIAVVTTAGYGCYLAGPGLIGGLAHAATLQLALVLPLILVIATATLAWSTRPT